MSDFTTLDRTATSQHGVLTYNQLRKEGFKRHQVNYRIRQGLLRRHHDNVYLLAGTRTCWEQRASAASLACRPLGALSHRAAARQYGFRTVDDDIDVVIRYPRRLKLDGVVVHRSCDLEAGDVTWVDGILTTTPERTICDLGLIFPDHEVSRILDHAIATGFVSRGDIEQLRRRISKQGRNGAGSVRRCLEDLPVHTEEAESGPEVAFLRLCERFGLPIPSRQLPVVVSGRRFRVDFAYPLHKVFIEIDGKATHGGYEAVANDDGRQNLLVAAGWTPIRFMKKHLDDDPEMCASIIRQVLANQSLNPNAQTVRAPVQRRPGRNL